MPKAPGINPRFLNDGMRVAVRPGLFGVNAKPGEGLIVTVKAAHGDHGTIEYKGKTELVSIWDMWVRSDGSEL